MQGTSSMYMDMSPLFIPDDQQRMSEEAQGSSAQTLFSTSVEELYPNQGFGSSNQRRRSNSLTRTLFTLLRHRRLRSQPQSQATAVDFIKASEVRPRMNPAVPNRAWFLAYYYELNQQIGEPFVGCYDQVIVDGLCAPSEAGRFCLGAIQNVERNSQVDQARRQIGAGVRIYRVGENVYAECLCEKIFVQSPLYALHAKDVPHTVYRVQKGKLYFCDSFNFIVFSSRFFYYGAVMEIFNSDFFLSLLHENASKGYRAVQSLQSLCHMRISFIKGWGKEYRRQTITATPCWIDAQLKIPLGKLDKVLSECERPTGTVYSFT
uniref:MH2 domain-containing protein n=1 Tax=Syphacia muris TaxID=451379 RepID=A0A0N5ALG2_9BILA